jgi:hypothetical protein
MLQNILNLKHNQVYHEPACYPIYNIFSVRSSVTLVVVRPYKHHTIEANDYILMINLLVILFLPIPPYY